MTLIKTNSFSFGHKQRTRIK